MRHYSHRFRVKSTLAQVSDFHHDPHTLRLLTPPPVFVQFHHLDPLSEGSVADFTMWLGPLPVRWVAVHTQVDPDQGFTDTQERGPFQSWVHRHSFESIDEETIEVVDDIQAEPSSHLFWGLISRLMWLNLPYLFWYRAWATRRQLEGSKV